MKVEQFYNKNQFIIKGEGKTVFQSYQSTIAEITAGGELVLHTDFDYSHTTQKHLYLFINDYYYLFNYETRNNLNGFDYSRNKREFLQNLIDNKKIKYIND